LWRWLVTLLYPFAKRVVSMPQAVLGVAFSFGIPMAYAAAQGGAPWELLHNSQRLVQGGFAATVLDSVPWQGWVLMAGNLFWVLAYDTEYAMVDRDDDLKIGMKTSAITLGRADVPAVTAFYLVFLGSGRPCCGVP
jgi:4-hydroxybenzoate polyprenyltransferase